MNLSNRERSIFGHLVFETGITVYYLYQAAQLPYDTLLNSKEWVDLVFWLIPVAIIGGILVGAVVLGTKTKITSADERDRGIEGKADGIAYRMMVTAIALCVGLLGFTYSIQPDLVPTILDKPLLVLPITPFTVLNVLIVIMLIAETTKYTSQLWFYRRGY